MRFVVAVISTGMILCAESAVGQIAPVVSARVERWSIDSGHLGSAEARNGFALTLGGAGTGGALRVAYGFVPQGDVEPGWTTVMAEAEPNLTLADVAIVGVRLAVGGFGMNVRNRHRAMEGCGAEIGCMFEARGYSQGWSGLASVAVVGGINVVPRISVTVSHGAGWLLGGRNPDERMKLWSLGLQYRFR